MSYEYQKLIRECYQHEQARSRFAANVALYSECRNRHRADLWAFAARHLSSPDSKYKVQFFDKDGLSGHSVCKSLTAAGELMFREGYTIPDSRAFSRMSLDEVDLLQTGDLADNK